MREAPGYKCLADIKADLDKALEGITFEQMDVLCAKSFKASRTDRMYMRLADRIQHLADMDKIHSPEWNKVAAQSEARATFIALRTAEKMEHVRRRALAAGEQGDVRAFHA